jgi:S-adenosylmethionine:tRNA ribosyltransferase-isomerase
MKLEDYTYNLPENLIAAHPPKVRGASRLLALNRKTGEISDSFYRNVADFFEKGDVLILNDTKVIKARIFTQKESGAERELVILERHGGDDDWHTHKVMYRGKIKAGDVLTVKNSNIKITVQEILGDGLAIVSSPVDLREVCENFGTVPLPPYMRRDATALDIERYQTVFAEEKGSVAAPTASLNMTPEILETLRAKGVKICYLTLHVGLGTFMPIRVDNLEEHKMHQEYFEIPAETCAEIRKAKTNGGRVFALGTTVARTLEYASAEILGEGEVFENSSPKGETQRSEVGERFSKHGDLTTKKLRGEADIFIYPGYEFKIVDGLMTNFHAPKSTVLMLASAFASWEYLSKAYTHAVEQDYHFLSYGDSMIIFEK